MLNTKRCVIAALLSIAMTPAFAGECVMQITRTACPGKQAESFSKCDGKASCNQTVAVESAAQCAAKSMSGCENKRYDVTQYKKVTASFDGAPIEDGKDFCVGHPDYPYANKPECK